jgi:hypothetical protein
MEEENAMISKIVFVIVVNANHLIKGYTGRDCSTEICINDCSFHGICKNQKCYCIDGFTGEDCSFPTCPNGCSGNGYCRNGKCFCDD